MKLRLLLPGAAVLVAITGVTAFALASHRIVAHQAASRGPAPGRRCLPGSINRSAVLAGTSVAVSPLPDSHDATPASQISLLGAPASSFSAIAVSGSQTGGHRGLLRGYSQGDGASFIPSSPFRAGETVTVRGRVRAGRGIRSFAFRFVVARPDVLVYTASAHETRDPNEMQHFHSNPALLAPVLAIAGRSPQSAPGYLFAAPYAGPGPSGPMIFDEAGNLVWFDPLPSGTEAANLQVQQPAGAPLLTWWQGRIAPQGFGQGEEMIADSSYRAVGRVHAGNGLKADLHDFHLTSQGTAVLTAFDPVYCDLSPFGGPRNGALTDSIYQELDVSTGLVRREWHSLDHVAPADSYSPAQGTTGVWPFDYFHLNSVDQLGDGTTLISARNTSALYRLNTLTGQVLARIGGRHSDVKLARGATTAYQHDATVLPDGTISIFDNGAVPKIHAQSRGLVVALDPHARTGAVVTQYLHPTPLVSGSQGNVQILANGNVFIGWGSEPYFSEFTASGQLLFDAHMHGSYQSYRAYRFPWTGAPAQAPSVAASGSGPVTVFASWNGDTRTAGWRVLAGPSPQQLAPVAAAPRTGFETAIATPGAAPYVAVQALDPAGAVLGTSTTIRG
jgi:Arylsulfotransferase (ASST)